MIKTHAPVDSSSLTQTAERFSRRDDVGELLFRIESNDDSFNWHYGNPEKPFFIASATKLYTTALLAQLKQNGLLDWDRPVAQYLPQHSLDRIHIYKGDDSSRRVTIRQLMAHTSGIPDYFEGKRNDGAAHFKRILRADQSWSLNDVIAISRDHQRAHFPPGLKNKALYSDTGYQLLGGVIENLFEKSFAECVISQIANPLQLAHTYCFSTQTLDRYADISPLLLKKVPLKIPQAMASVGADGGIVSTLNDSMCFIKAFMNGQLFSLGILEELQSQFNRIFFPLEYGVGLMRFQVPWFFSPFLKFPPLFGHSGASGTVLFYCKDWDLFVAGTVNQVANRSLPFQLMMQLLAKARAVRSTR
jgi:D-alanyl-D-alanine carboxypeptidase